jgi:uncharacterized protein YecT (DUF1311 family)
MRIRLTIPVLFLLLLSFNLMSASGQTQTDLNKSACDEYQRKDTELNKTYLQVLNLYKDDAAFIQKLKLAQRAWITFRDAQLAALFPAADTQVEYGSIYPVCRSQTLSELTAQRTAQLRRWIDGIEEGDVCGGSIRVKPAGAHNVKRGRRDHY